MFRQTKCAAYQVWITAIQVPLGLSICKGENYETVALDGDTMIHFIALYHKRTGTKDLEREILKSYNSDVLKSSLIYRSRSSVVCTNTSVRHICML